MTLKVDYLSSYSCIPSKGVYGYNDKSEDSKHINQKNFYKDRATQI